MAISSFSSAVSSLQTSQRALEVIGNNLANANTPGYHRQSAQLANRTPNELGGLSFGRGVQILDVRRIRSEVLETSITSQNSETGGLEGRLQLLTRLESRVSIESASPLTTIENLFNNLEQLSTRLDDDSLRNVIATEAKSLTDQFNDLSNDLQQLQLDIDEDIRTTVDEVNSASTQIAQLNVDISRAEAHGTTAADLRDLRDEQINQIANLTNVRVTPGNNGQSTVISNSVVLVIAKETVQLGTRLSPDADAAITIEATDTAVPIAGGKLGGLLGIRNGILKDVRERLDELANRLVAEFDTLHTKGVGTSGSFTRLDTRRNVDDIAANLDSAGLAFPPTAGELTFAVTDTSTGDRVLTTLPPLDPGAVSLTGLAAMISATVANVTAVESAENGSMTILSAPGFKFDFAGGVDSTPTYDMTGTGAAQTTTSALTLGGAVESDSNDVYSFTFSGTGTVGVTTGLQVTVTNSAGTNIATLDIGQGYEAGTELEVANGITVAFGAGDVTANEVFDADVIGDADTGNFLRALGLNTFFTGSSARDISVNQDIINDPGRIATSRSGQPSDSSNLQRLVAVRESRVFANGEQDVRSFSSAIIADIGVEVRETTQLKDTADTLAIQLEAERASVSGVDPNEELVEMVKFQRQFEIAARFLTTINQTLDDLLAVV